MKKSTILLLALLMGCAPKKENGNLTEKKQKLESLRKQKTELEASITKLEGEIALADPSAAKEEKAKLVTIDTIAPEPFIHLIDLQGKIEAVNISYVTPRGGGGQVKELLVKKGDVVRKGQLLLKLDNVILNRSLAAANKSLETIKTQLAFAKTIYKKQQNLWDQNIGTEVQLLTAKNNVETLETQLKSAEEQLTITEEQISFTNVTADVSGVAEDVNVRVGEFFNGAGQIRIVNTDDLKVTAQVPENYVNKVGVGSKLKIVLPDINKTIEATITVASRLIDAASRSFYIEAKIPDDKDFHPNQIALVKIQDYQSPKAITVPVNTLQSDEKGKYVLVAETVNGKLLVKKKVVVTGELYGDKLEILSGLQAGEALIVDGFQSLYEGQLITTDAK